MSTEPRPEPQDATAPPTAETLPSAVLAPTAPSAVARGTATPTLVWVLAAVAAVALVSSGLLWQKLSGIQEQLARQSADAGEQAVEARTMARQAQEQARELAARTAVAEARLSEVALQRTQLEELMQSLSRSRDENLVVDIESALRLAQQQAQLTGSAEPLLAALRTADQRISRAAQPRLAPLQRAIARDTERIRGATVTDLAALLVKLDELARAADDLPLVNGAPGPTASVSRDAPPPADAAWWRKALLVLREEARGLVRVSRIDRPEAALLTPEQSFFVRENFKLKLLNVRLGLLARQPESSRAEIAAAVDLVNRYFDPASRKTQQAAGLLQQLQAQVRAVELPRLDESLTALATAAAGR